MAGLRPPEPPVNHCEIIHPDGPAGESSPWPSTGSTCRCPVAMPLPSTQPPCHGLEAIAAVGAGNLRQLHLQLQRVTACAVDAMRHPIGVRDPCANKSEAGSDGQRLQQVRRGVS